MPFFEANLDGSLVLNQQYLDFNPLEEVENSLRQKNWTFNELERGGTSMLKGDLNLGEITKQITLTIGKIQNQEEGRNPREKRIQISPQNTTIGHDFEETGNDLYTIIGVYKREIYDDTVFCAWSSEVIRNPNTQISVRVKIDLIAEALVKGFARTYNDAHQIVCAFRPEFIHYYLLHKEGLHSTEPEKELEPITVEKVKKAYSQNLIYFGAPGTGKSHIISQYTNDANSIRITFHPDTDYAAFVGSYKPIKPDNGDGITYGFVPQPFLKAYIKAWETEEDTFLIIEEINRGNCAQIFGDIFQIIEREENGFSRYKVDVDTEIEKYLKNHFDELSAKGDDDGVRAERYFAYFNREFNKIALPNNLYIHATMNTSDQSLFPIDSAFKRRWDWEYVPILFDETEADDYMIQIAENKYSWRNFIETVNKKIKDVTESEDKKLGQFFVKAFDSLIPENIFKAKVMFYIWNDILREESQTDGKYFFRTSSNPEDNIGTPFSFSDLFSNDHTAILIGFMTYLGIPIVPRT